MKTFVNARLVLKDRLVQNGFLSEDGGLITELGEMCQTPAILGEAVDCRGLFLSPGFIDIHTHGGGGFDFMDGRPQDILGGARAHMAHGTTGIMPTTMTSSDEDLFSAIDAYREAKKEPADMPHLLGLHLEGPYFALEHAGAQPGKYLLNPAPAHYNKVLEYAGGDVRRWSFAPELPGGLEMAKALKNSGMLLSAGHTNATFEQMELAFERGVTHLTHFYSSMSSIVRVNGHRKLGVVESGYLLDGLTIELIADGVHLPPELLRMILRLKNHAEICLCTDSMRGAGMPDGRYVLGSLKDGQEVIVENGVANMPDRSCFAGSVATTDRLVRVMVYKAGLPLWEAVKMASLNPARFIGEDAVTGSLAPGKRADLVLFDDDITVQSVYVSGKKTV